MASFSKKLLSGSTNGKGIKIAQTATAGTLLHTAITGTSDIDEVWLYAVNTSDADATLTFEWGEVTSPDGNIPLVVEANSGLTLCISGLLLNNSLVIRAFASVADVIVVHGYVNRITA